MTAEKWSLKLIGFFMIMNNFLYGQDSLQKKQLLCLMEASRSRYINMAAVLSYKSYRADQNNNKLKLLTEINIDWKQVPGRVYARQEVCYSSYEDTKETTCTIGARSMQNSLPSQIKKKQA